MRHENFKKTKLPGLFKATDGSGRWYVRAAIRVDGQIVAIKKLLPAVNPTTGRPYDDVEAFIEFKALKEQAKARTQTPPPTPTPHPQDTCQTVQQYCVRWLKVRAARLSPSTAEGYAEAINDRILPRMGWMKCTDVTRQAVEAWVVWIEAQVQPAQRTMMKRGMAEPVTYDNPHAGEPYCEATMRKWWRCLKTILGDMAADFGDMKNPVLRIRHPQRPELASRREQRTLDAEVTGRILAATQFRFPQHFACIAVMAMTGMRAGEVFALQWDVVDFAAGTITVKRAVSKGTLRQRTKTGSPRTVPMHPELADILEAHQQAQTGKEHLGLSSGLLFPSEDGKVRIPSSLRKVWPKVAELVNTDIRVANRVLRRSMNTRLVEAGVDRTVIRAIMGHMGEAMTQLYTGVDMNAKMNAFARIQPTLAAAGVEPPPTIH